MELKRVLPGSKRVLPWTKRGSSKGYPIAPFFPRRIYGVISILLSVLSQHEHVQWLMMICFICANPARFKVTQCSRHRKTPERRNHLRFLGETEVRWKLATSAFFQHGGLKGTGEQVDREESSPGIHLTRHALFYVCLQFHWGDMKGKEKHRKHWLRHSWDMLIFCFHLAGLLAVGHHFLSACMESQCVNRHNMCFCLLKPE